jgi:hypothetical protein
MNFIFHPFLTNKSTTMKLVKTIESLHAEARHIIESGRKAAYHAVNTNMVKTYWEIGQLIVEEEQQGEERAKYG